MNYKNRPISNKLSKKCGWCKKIVKSKENIFCCLRCAVLYNAHKKRNDALEKYYKNPHFCKQCGKIIKVKGKTKVNETKRRQCCSKKCSNKYKIKYKQPQLCVVCSKIIPSRRKRKFCNSSCYNRYLYIEYINKWKNGEISGIKYPDGISSHINRYMREKYGNKCARCGWHKLNKYTKKIPLQVEHIDGHWYNNKEENLILICPNCHSLTETYGCTKKQKGHGRPSRYKNKLSDQIII
jgi:hypothetical protein